MVSALKERQRHRQRQREQSQSCPDEADDKSKSAVAIHVECGDLMVKTSCLRIRHRSGPFWILVGLVLFVFVAAMRGAIVNLSSTTRSNINQLNVLVMMSSSSNKYQHNQQQQQQQQQQQEHQQQQNQVLANQSRSILLVHIGKSGGLSLRSSTSLKCRNPPTRQQRMAMMMMMHRDKSPFNRSNGLFNNRILPGQGPGQGGGLLNSTAIAACVDQEFAQDQVLARQTTGVFHVNRPRPNIAQTYTSFLFTLRNPVDRIVSAYRYHHPGNCVPKNDHEPVPGGCKTINVGGPQHSNRNSIHHRTNNQNMMLNSSQSPFHRAYMDCFPSPAMEDFAQSVLPPYYNFSKKAPTMADAGAAMIAAHHQNDDNNNNMTRQQQEELGSSFLGRLIHRRHQSLQGHDHERQHHQTNATALRECRSIARAMVQGTFEAATHMQKNFRFYTSYTIDMFPNKEVFAVRITHEHQDMVQLDIMLGGRGNYSQMRTVSHASEKYAPSPLSIEAYHKLCCVLHQEIDIYLRVLDLAINLDATAKAEQRDTLWHKCNIEPSYKEWKAACQAKLLLET